MKRMTVLIMFLSIMFIATSAAAVDIMLGLKGGVNIANVHGEDIPEDNKTRLGFIGGVSFDFKVHEMFSLQPELLYSMKGCKLTAGDDEAVWKFNYIEIPVLVKLHIPAGEAVDPSFFVGPAVGMNLSADFEITEDSETESIDISDNVKDVEFSVVVGAGLDITVGERGAFIIDLRFDYGLTTLDDTSDPDDFKNWAFGAMIGYGFKF
jgi:hypothetical protein